MRETDHELEFLLSLSGFEFRFAQGYRVKFVSRRVARSRGRPHGIRYSLTLHDPAGKRIYGLDNAHGVGSRRAFDHRHVYDAGYVVPYRFGGPAQLLEDFYREVEKILRERGAI